MHTNQSFKRIEGIQIKYEVLRLIGRGGMGQVYLVKSKQNGKKYAMKVARKGQGRLNNETRMLTFLKHPGIPRFVERWQEGHWDFLVMEYVKGITLKQYIEENGKISGRHLESIIIQICEILEYLHSFQPPVLYMDLKPSNIMIHPKGIIRLIDFGISMFQGEQNQFLGTNGYASPEQRTSQEHIDVRTDIYSLGKVCEFCGKSTNIQWMLTKCTRKNPQQRYDSVSEIRIEIKKELDRNNLQKGMYTWIFFVAVICLVSFLEGRSYLVVKKARKEESAYQNIITALSENLENISWGNIWRDIKCFEKGGNTIEEYDVITDVYLTYGNKMEAFGNVWEDARLCMKKMKKAVGDANHKEIWNKIIEEKQLEIEERFARNGEEGVFMKLTEAYIHGTHSSEDAWKGYKRRILFLESQGKDVSLEYERFLEKYPKEGTVYLEYGIYLCQKGKWERAKDIYGEGKKNVKSFEKYAEKLKEKLCL